MRKTYLSLNINIFRHLLVAHLSSCKDAYFDSNKLSELLNKYFKNNMSLGYGVYSINAYYIEDEFEDEFGVVKDFYEIIDIPIYNSNKKIYDVFKNQSFEGMKVGEFTIMSIKIKEWHDFDDISIFLEIKRNSAPLFLYKLRKYLLESSEWNKLCCYISNLYYFFPNTYLDLMSWFRRLRYRKLYLYPDKIDMNTGSRDSIGWEIFDLLFVKEEIDKEKIQKEIIDTYQYIRFLGEGHFYYKFSEKNARAEVETNNCHNTGYSVMFEDDKRKDTDIALFPITRSIAKDRLDSLLNVEFSKFRIMITDYEYDNSDITYMTFSIMNKRYSSIFRKIFYYIVYDLIKIKIN